ncbi:MAG: DUF1573 domain-containing protein [Porphyromonadaceae bacterium]
MKKIIIMTLMMLCTFGYASAQNKADIKFDKTSHNFGTFSEKSPVQKCTFTFTNVGNAPLVINQAVASCGCTVAAYTKTPIAPGQKGEITITYNGTGRPFGHFKKNITIRTNAIAEMTRLYIEGEMTE